MKNIEKKMTHVSFETALKLREIGFTQPQPNLWQKWYCEVTDDRDWCSLMAGESFTITGIFPPSRVPTRLELAFDTFDGHSQYTTLVNFPEATLTDFSVYAPTLEDLLACKPRIEAITPLILTVQPAPGGFAAGYLPHTGSREHCILYQAENAAEAAAKAILNAIAKTPLTNNR